MPKAVLEYNLPEESDEYQDAMDGTALRGAAQELSNYLRSIRKYSELNDAERELLERIEKKFYEEFGELVWK